MSAESEELARRLNLILDALYVAGSHRVTHSEIQTHLEQQSMSLSRRHWAYLLDGRGTRNPSERLLVGVAEYFGVDPSYLLDLDSDTVPESIEQQLKLVKIMRLRDVRAITTRRLGDVSPELLQQLTDLIDRHVEAVDPGSI